MVVEEPEASKGMPLENKLNPPRKNKQKKEKKSKKESPTIVP